VVISSVIPLERGIQLVRLSMCRGLPRGSMMSLANLGRIVAIACACLMLLASPAPGKDEDDSWTVKHDVIGKEKNKQSKDVSGIACTTQKGFPRTCLII